MIIHIQYAKFALCHNEHQTSGTGVLSLSKVYQKLPEIYRKFMESMESIHKHFTNFIKSELIWHNLVKFSLSLVNLLKGNIEKHYKSFPYNFGKLTKTIYTLTKQY